MYHTAAVQGSNGMRVAMQPRLPVGRDSRTCGDVQASAVVGKRCTRMLLTAAFEAMRARTGCTAGQERSKADLGDIGVGRQIPGPAEGHLTSTILTCCSRSCQLSAASPRPAARAPVGMRLAVRPRLEVGEVGVDRRVHPFDGYSVPGSAAAVAAAGAVSWAAASRESWQVPT